LCLCCINNNNKKRVALIEHGASKCICTALKRGLVVSILDGHWLGQIEGPATRLGGKGRWLFGSFKTKKAFPFSFDHFFFLPHLLKRNLYNMYLMYYLNNEGERVYTLKVIIKKSNYKKKSTLTD